MKAKPASVGGSNKLPVTGSGSQTLIPPEVADKCRAQNKRRRGLHDLKKTDSTIATVTVVLEKDASEENGAIEIALSDENTNTEQVGKEKKENVGGDSKCGASKRALNTKERTGSSRMPGSGSVNSGVTVFDLEDLSKLPTEVRELLACPGDGFCIHDHERCQVVNNKLYVHNARPSGKVNDKRQQSRSSTPCGSSDVLRTTGRQQQQGKRVTFVPTHKSTSPEQAHVSACESSASESNILPPRKRMPPPPRGYHIRIEPSSPELSGGLYSSAESTWPGIGDVSKYQTGHSDTLQGAIKTAISELKQRKQRSPRKKIKENFKKKNAVSSDLIAKSVQSQIKKLGFNSEYVLLAGNEGENSLSIRDDGALGDRNTANTIDPLCGDMDEELCALNTFKISDTDSDNEHRARVKCKHKTKRGTKQIPSPNARHNKVRLRQTRRDRKNANNNSHTLQLKNNHLNIQISTRSGYGCYTVDADNSLLNTNTNASNEFVEELKNPPQHLNTSPPSAALGFETSPEPSESQTTAAVATDLEISPTVFAAIPTELQQDQSPSFLCQALISTREVSLERAALSEGEPDGWDVRKNTLATGDEASQHKLQKQEIDDDESKDLTTSENAPSRAQSEGRKPRRKKKSTESVYVKFKTSLSKKTTTTTTLKEVNQPDSPLACGTSTSLMLESDNSRMLTISKLGEQSLSAPMPRHTRIVKCGEMDMSNKKRKMSSDTEEEKAQVEGQTAKWADKDSMAPVQSETCKDKKYVEVSACEDYVDKVKEQQYYIASQLSPKQSLRKENEDDNAECDVLSEKASVITVISVTEMTQETGSVKKHPTPQSTDGDDMVAVVGKEEPESPPCLSGTLNNQLFRPPSSRSSRCKERMKKKKGGKKKVETRKISPKQIDLTSPPPETLQAKGKRLSETSLSQDERKSTPASSVEKMGKLSSMNSSPPGCRKKKSGLKKKSPMHKEMPDGSHKRHNKGRIKSPEKRKKYRSSVARGDHPRKTGSSSSSSSEKKKKMSTLSAESADEQLMDVEKASVRSEAVAVENGGADGDIQETSSPGGLNIGNSQKTSGAAHSGTQETTETGSKEKGIEEITKMMDGKDVEQKVEGKHVQRTISKGTRAFARSLQVERDLQKAEMGWNSSVYHVDTSKTKAPGTKAKAVPRRPKLKYYIIKAKDKNVENGNKKALKNNSPKFAKPVKASDNTVYKCEANADCQGDSTQRAQGKTVQFSESIEKMEDLKTYLIMEEDGATVDHETGTHFRDNLSEGSLADVSSREHLELIKEAAEPTQAPESKSHIESDNQGLNTSPKRHRRPVWLKKAPPKPVEAPVETPSTPVPVKTLQSPVKLEKKKDSFEEVLMSTKCNIQVTYPLPASTTSSKSEQTSLTTRVAYTSLLSNIFLALPLKKTVRRMVAQRGSPVDIKEVTEGSSVDAADYSKALKYSPNAKRPVVPAPAPGAVIKRKKSPAEPRGVAGIAPPARFMRPVLGESGSSLASFDSEQGRCFPSPNCSFSTDMDEAAVSRQRLAHSAPPGRMSRVSTIRNKERRTASRGAAIRAAVGRAARALPWHLVNNESGAGPNQEVSPSHSPDRQTDLAQWHVAGDAIETSISNQGLGWVMQGFLTSLSLPNLRRLRCSVYRTSTELSMEPEVGDQTLRP